MPARPAPSLAVVCLSVVADGLAVLLPRRSGAAAGIPSAPIPARGPVTDGARSVVRALLNRVPSWSAQAGVVTADGLQVVVVALVPAGTAAGTGSAWVPVDRVPSASAAAVRLALGAVRDRLDHEPVAFLLLPSPFTLSDLQRVYELLLTRRLHKASFRRTLLAAHLVEPINEWRSEGRGRPAQLHRYRPRRRRPAPRPVRFELLH